ncbi:MAG: LPS export ABC transporter periplasmic protein LptC [Candidatus Omnitrophica bacterium]|jgi:LPS export ABC transporter protein LptC|nr:LPS export ABC transporter periplasmic protein LptC [Candidatus Omnitrophota bacterium]
MSKAVLILLFFLISFPAYAAKEKAVQQETSDQQISDFSLAGYGDKGKKSWELSGKNADIFDDVVKLKSITGNLYGEGENVKLTSDRGDFDKAQGKVHLEQNVVITTTSGAKLTTNSLDWDRKNSTLATKDVVNITRENMFTSGRGAYGQPNLKKVNLEKDVTVEIKPQPKDAQSPPQESIVITCNGPLEVDYEKNIAIFNNNVKVDRTDSQIYCDTMSIYFLKSGQKEEVKKEKKEEVKGASLMANTKIDKLICRGNVRIVRGENVSYSEEAIYSALDKKIILSGRPKLILYSTEEFANAPLGN